MARRALISRLALSSAALISCMPEPVRTADEWLAAYTSGDHEGVIARTTETDRNLVRKALSEIKSASTGTFAAALPPRPLDHEIVEVVSKDGSTGRWVVLLKLVLKNPLPYASERVGQELPDMPRTRVLRRRLLVVRNTNGPGWGVKLDLGRVIERAHFAREFERMIEARRFDDAASMLVNVPPPPDDSNALPNEDRLAQTLGKQLSELRDDKLTTDGSTRAAGP